MDGLLRSSQLSSNIGHFNLFPRNRFCKSAVERILVIAIPPDGADRLRQAPDRSARF